MNAATYVVVVAVLVVIGPQLTARQPEMSSMRSAISQGLRYARFTPEFRSLITLVSLFAITSAVIQAVLPVHTVALGGAEATYGILLGAMGAGALIGAVMRQRVLARISSSSVPYTIGAFGMSGVIFGVAPDAVFGFGVMLAIGFFWLLTLSTLNASAQLMAPEWIRGRAMSLYTLAFAGILPIGSILSGAVADWIGTTGSLVVFSSGAILVGFLAPRFRVPAIHEIETPEFTSTRSAHADVSGLEGGPVIVLNTWKIDEEHLAEFASVMSEIRLVRLTTGAYRWRLFRDIADPTRLTELFAVQSWEEHLAQHRRIDDTSAELIAKARAFDVDDGPRSRHLIAIDVEDPLDFDAMIHAHSQMHAVDSSVRLESD